MHDVSACKCSSICQNHDTMLWSSLSRSHHLGICIQMNELRMNEIITATVCHWNNCAGLCKGPRTQFARTPARPHADQLQHGPIACWPGDVARSLRVGLSQTLLGSWVQFRALTSWLAFGRVNNSKQINRVNAAVYPSTTVVIQQPCCHTNCIQSASQTTDKATAC